MTRQNIIILFLAILILTLFGGVYWYYTRTDAPRSPFDLFPGESGLRPIDPTATSSDPLPDDDVSLPGQQDAPVRRLYELHKAPVVGVGIIETKDKKGVVLSVSARYVERGLGHIFETSLSPVGLESRIVNETRTRLSEALWGNGGKSVVLRYVDDKDNGAIATRIINIAPQASFIQSTSTISTEQPFYKTEEVYLPEGSPFMAVSDDGADKLFYLLGESGMTASFKDTGILKIFSSPFTEWLPQFPNQKLVTITTKPSAKVPGYLFFINTQNKSMTKVLGSINGLTTLTSRDGKLVLFSETKGGPELSLYNVAKKEKAALYLQTLPEKCVWGKKRAAIVYCAVPQPIPQGYYPDQWYQGLVSFSDELWEIDSVTSIGRKIMDTKSMGAPPLDMINLAVSSDDTYLIFMNKISGTPWVYRLTEAIPVIKSVSAPTQNNSFTRVPEAPEASPSSDSLTTLPQSILSPDMKRLR